MAASISGKGFAETKEVKSVTQRRAQEMHLVGRNHFNETQTVSLKKAPAKQVSVSKIKKRLVKLSNQNIVNSSKMLIDTNDDSTVIGVPAHTKPQTTKRA